MHETAKRAEMLAELRRLRYGGATDEQIAHADAELKALQLRGAFVRRYERPRTHPTSPRKGQ